MLRFLLIICAIYLGLKIFQIMSRRRSSKIPSPHVDDLSRLGKIEDAHFEDLTDKPEEKEGSA